MEPYERVIAALECTPADRVPMRLNARREVMEALRAHFRVNTDEQVLRCLDIDFRYVSMRYTGPKPRRSFLPDNAPPPPDKRVAVTDGGIANTFRVYAPFANMRAPSELDAYEEFLDDQLQHENPRHIPSDIDRINSDRRYFIGFKIPGRVFMRSQEIRGAERFLIDLAVHPEFAERLMEILAVHAIKRVVRVLDAAGEKIDVLQYNDDLGTQQSLMISPAMFRRFLLPRYRRIFDTVHAYGKRVFMHSCGAVRAVIPDLIDAGVDILNPIQVGAVGMEPEGLKRDFGDRLAFCGGIDVQSTLPFGTTGDVRREVADRIRVLGAGGGYILDSTNLIQPDTPVENVLAMFDAGRAMAPSS